MGRQGVRVTDEQRAEFLATLAVCGNMTKACEVADFNRITVYRDMEADPEFKKAVQEARRIGGEGLIDEMRRRGYEGWDEPTTYQGELIASIRKYSDTLLIFLVKCIFPQYRDSKVRTEHSGKILLDHGLDLTKLSDEELRAVRDLLEKARVEK